MKGLISLILLICLSTTNAGDKLDMDKIGLFNPHVPEKDFNEELLNKRTNMLHHHKKMGHITMGLMLASAATAIWGVHKIDDARSRRGGVKHRSDANKLKMHMGVAGLTLASYFTTAYFSMAAPKPTEMQDSNAKLWHKHLAWIHGASMILSPILGYLAYKDYEDGKDPSGVAKLHKPLMFAGIGAFAASYSIAVYNW